MNEYHKIKSVFMRDQRGRFTDQLADPIFDYLKDNMWSLTEKVDGTNIRIHWDHEKRDVWIGGRTKDASIPVFLLDAIRGKFTPELFSIYPDVSMTLYGEGFGRKIQKDGHLYIPDGNDFVLFDVFIAGLWLTRDNVEDVAVKLGIGLVPEVARMRLFEAIEYVKSKPLSKWGQFVAEGVVLRPLVEMQTRRGERVITKLKVKDFR